MDPQSANPNIDLETEALMDDLSLGSNALVGDHQPDHRDLVDELRELITLIPRPPSPDQSRASSKRFRSEKNESVIREIDEQTQNELAECLVRQMQTFETGLLEKFDSHR